MDATPEGSEQVHRVKAKPGPKPKGKSHIELIKTVITSTFPPLPVAAVEAPTGGQIWIRANGAAQSLALRIWAGQSVDVPVIERVARIAAGLKEQGFSLDVDLPHPDAARYMEAHK